MTTGNHATRDALERALADGGGVLRLEPGMGRPGDSCPPDGAWDCPRRTTTWASAASSASAGSARPRRPTTAWGPPDEGLSYLALDGGVRLTLRDAVEMAPGLVDGPGVCGDRPRPGTAGQDFDFADRIPYHIHPARRVRGAGRTQPQGRGVLLPLRRRHGPPPRVVLRGPSLDRGATRVRRPAAVSRRLGQRPDPAARARGAARRRGGLPHPRRASSMPRAPR